MSKVVDCAHILYDGIPLWPGTIPFDCKHILNHSEHGIVVDRFEVPAAMGTHIDAPYHFIADGITVEKITTTQLYAPLCVIAPAGAHQDFQLTAHDIRAWEKTHGVLPQGCHVFINWGWHTRWPTRDFSNADESGVMHFPSLAEDAASLFVERGVGLVGVDTFSPDHPATTLFPVHKKLLGNNIIILETLTNLNDLPPVGATSLVAPLKVRGAAEAPSRVFVFIP